MSERDSIGHVKSKYRKSLPTINESSPLVKRVRFAKFDDEDNANMYDDFPCQDICSRQLFIGIVFVIAIILLKINIDQRPYDPKEHVSPVVYFGDNDEVLPDRYITFCR